MKRAKTLSIFSVIAIMLLAISCTATPQYPLESGNTVYTASKYESKAVQVDIEMVNTDVAYYKYRLTPQWDQNDKGIVGVTDGWVTTTAFPTDWNIWLSQGYWKIEIQMYDSRNRQIGDSFEEYRYINSSGSLLCKGFAEWLLASGTGSISFEDIIVPKLYELPVRYEMTGNDDSKEIKNYFVHWVLFKDNVEKYSGNLQLKNTDDAYTTFGDYTLSNIPVGYYTLSLMIYEGLDSDTSSKSGGEMAAVSILRGCTAKINAQIRTSEFVNSTFRAQQTETGYTGKIKASYSAGATSARLELISENATDVKWYQNGVYKSEYGNTTVANVKNIKTGALGIGLLGTCSNYFDCVFTNRETGKTSSCSYVLVAAGRYSGSNDDSSVFSLETGNEITGWNYLATPLSGIGETIYGAGVGSTTKSIYLDEGKWNIQASALNIRGVEISNGTFTGYINKSDNTIDIPLGGINGDGFLEIGTIISSRINDVNSNNRTLSWTVTDLATGTELTQYAGSTSTYTTTSQQKWQFAVNRTYTIPNGAYKVTLFTKCVTSGFGSQTYTGYCTTIVNIHTGVTTIIQGTLTSNYLN